MPENPNEYRVMLRFSVMFNEFWSDSRNDVDHGKYFSDLRRQSTVDFSFNKASILLPNLFYMTYEALKHHRFDRPPRTPPNSHYSSKIARITYPGDEFKTERDSAIALITQHHSKNPDASSFITASTQQAGTSLVGINLLGLLWYDLSFIPPPALPVSTVQAQASGNPTTSTLSVSS